MTDFIDTHDLLILPPAPAAITIAGQVANTAAAQSVFADYQQRVATNTLKRQANDLALFRRYLADAGLATAAGVIPHSEHALMQRKEHREAARIANDGVRLE